MVGGLPRSMSYGCCSAQINLFRVLWIWRSTKIDWFMFCVNPYEDGKKRSLNPTFLPTSSRCATFKSVRSRPPHSGVRADESGLIVPHGKIKGEQRDSVNASTNPTLLGRDFLHAAMGTHDHQDTFVPTGFRKPELDLIDEIASLKL